jgi:NADPH:quinone reductase-like Zn-dependent oxidoreductase
LIWGASSSVGTSTLQLANNLGFKVFATASPAHHKTLKSLGAFEVFDYHDSAVVQRIVAAAKSTGTPITLGFDAVGEGKSYKQAAYVLGASGGIQAAQTALDKLKAGVSGKKLVITIDFCHH